MSRDRPQILVFQHIDIEHPGIFRNFLEQDGLSWTAVELDEGETIPELGDFDALWVMGGPMDVWEDDQYPWLVDERAAIHEAVVERRMPFLGFCLGHQLLATALGGRVGPADEPEIGILEVELTAAGEASPIFTGLTKTYDCLQWHSAEVLEQPQEVKILARSPACRVQAMAFEQHAFSIQYHIEITASTVREWGAVPAYRRALEDRLGRDALPAFESRASAHLADFNRSARRIYDNFMKVVRQI